MPCAVVSEDAMEGTPPALDPTTGKCSQADADLYLGKMLASYPDVDDLFMSSGKVPQPFCVDLWPVFAANQVAWYMHCIMECQMQFLISIYQRIIL